MDNEQLQALGLPWPGERYSKLEGIEVARDSQTVRWGPPAPPRGYDIDEDGDYVRDWTPEESAAADAAYREAMAEWTRTGGMWVTQGPTVITATFASTGAKSEMRWTGKEWITTSVESDYRRRG